MSDRPIIFSSAMVRALLDGRKTMTRRLAWNESFTLDKGRARKPTPWQKVKPGDRLWVRENFRVQQVNRICDGGGWYLWVCIDYEADGHRTWIKVYENVAPKILCERGQGPSGEQTKLLPCIHLPKIASRLTLVVTAAKIERLQDISEEDAEAEGIESELWDQAVAYRNYAEPDGWFCMWGGEECYTKPGVYVAMNKIRSRSFRSLWESLHGSASWDANPEVAAISFTVHRANIDAIPAGGAG